MNEEIKLSISKRDLTYYIISVFMIVLAWFLGVWWGKRGNLQSVNFSEPRLLTTDMQTVHSQKNEQQFIPSNRVGQGTTSDELHYPKSWSAALGEENIPEYTTHDYYNTNNTTSTLSTESSTSISEPDNSLGKYVASKNGTKYYPVGCKSADRIKTENRVYFATAEEAEIEGLSATSTCK